ncbi:MAG: hypothetical protein R3C44_23315 [Chloroflexota bacterium]
MPADLLLTKLYRPAIPARRVTRPFLYRRLDDGLAAERPLTLVSAPAGSGKTFCISEWTAGLDLPVAWLSLDPADDDPGRFFTYLLAALQQVDSRIGREVDRILRAGQLPPPDVLTTALVNDILAHENGRFVLVLDDFQVIQDEAILQVVRTLVANPPPRMHLVLLTREEPSLPLARLRANNRLTEIRGADLRFSTEETTDFLNTVMGLDLDPDDVAALAEKSEGWIAGLQLAGLSIRDRADASAFIAGLSGSHRHILSYLTEEVLNQQPPEIERFLLQTSILDKLTGDLCDAVIDGQNGRLLIEQLYEDNLFLIPLDDERHWYRYHHLFAGLLRDRQQANAEETADLHRRASRWYADHGLPGDAIEHAIRAADYETAVALIEVQGMDMLMAWHARTLQRWLQAIPDEWTAQSPRINLVFAWMYPMSGRFPEAIPTFNDWVSCLPGKTEPAMIPGCRRSGWRSRPPCSMPRDNWTKDWLRPKRRWRLSPKMTTTCAVSSIVN